MKHKLPRIGYNLYSLDYFCRMGCSYERIVKWVMMIQVDDNKFLTLEDFRKVYNSIPLNKFEKEYTLNYVGNNLVVLKNL